MYNNKSILGVIPARGGSEGLKGKNIKPLCEKPLIAWSIQQAQGSHYLDEVMVTTDDPTIAGVAKQYGANVPFLRPPSLALAHSSSVDTVKHTLEFYSKQNRHFDYILLLEPTSPLREPHDIDSMIEQLIEKPHFDAMVSVGEVREHPYSMKKMEESRLLVNVENSSYANQRRQDNPIYYFPYGVGYLIKVDTLLSQKTFYPKRTTLYPIKRYQCYEIDDLYDFLCIETLMKFQWNLS